MCCCRVASLGWRAFLKSAQNGKHYGLRRDGSEMRCKLQASARFGSLSPLAPSLVVAITCCTIGLGRSPDLPSGQSSINSVL